MGAYALKVIRPLEIILFKIRIGTGAAHQQYKDLPRPILRSYRSISPETRFAIMFNEFVFFICSLTISLDVYKIVMRDTTNK